MKVQVLTAAAFNKQPSEATHQPAVRIMYTQQMQQGVKTLRTQDTSNPRHFSTSDEVSVRHFDTSAPVPNCLDTLALALVPRCLTDTSAPRKTLRHRTTH